MASVILVTNPSEFMRWFDLIDGLVIELLPCGTALSSAGA